jgi:hypothetical protein
MRSWKHGSSRKQAKTGNPATIKRVSDTGTTSGHSARSCYIARMVIRHSNLTKPPARVDGIPGWLKANLQTQIKMADTFCMICRIQTNPHPDPVTRKRISIETETCAGCKSSFCKNGKCDSSLKFTGAGKLCVICDEWSVMCQRPKKMT